MYKITKDQLPKKILSFNNEHNRLQYIKHNDKNMIYKEVDYPEKKWGTAEDITLDIFMNHLNNIDLPQGWSRWYYDGLKKLKKEIFDNEMKEIINGV